ncbi:MAG: ABC transporter permease [bacterium]|nr:ABC transporter permease [bacterium]
MSATEAATASVRYDRAREGATVLAVYLTSIAVALLTAALVLLATGGSPTSVLSALLDGSVRGPGRWGTTIGVAVPLLLVALGTIINAKAGLVNLGQEGQLYLGAAFGTYVFTHIGVQGPGVLILVILAGIAGGGIWAGIAAALRYKRRMPEVLTTLLLVFVASQAVGYGLKNSNLLLDPTPDQANRNVVSDRLHPSTRIPRLDLFGNDFAMTAFIALLLGIIVALMLRWTIVGFRLQMLGRGPRTAHRAGVSEARYGGLALVVSGAFCGLAGVIMLTSGDFGNYRLTPGFPVNIGWEGLLVALVARDHPLVAIPVAFIFAGLRTGSGFLAATGVDRDITQVVQALLVLALLVPPAILFVRDRRRTLAAAADRV